MSRAIQAILIAYAVAAVAAVVAAYTVPWQNPLVTALAADIAATCAIFTFSFAFRNSSFYDVYWSVAPPVIAVYWLLGSSVAGLDSLRRWVVVLLVCTWAVRLSWNWARGWQGLAHEDWRYVDYRKSTGRAYWLLSFGGIHMAPTLWVFLACLPLYPALALGTRPFGALDCLAVLVTAGSVWIEARADKELLLFKGSNPPADVTLVSGLRRFSRHPNYLGEIGFWWGLFLFGLAADPTWWWTVAGAVSITLLFRFISLRLIEDHMFERRPDYAAYAERTSLLIPRRPSSPSSG